MQTSPQPATTAEPARGLTTAARLVVNGASKWAIWLVVIAAALVGQALSPYFLTQANMLNLLAQSSVLGIAAVGVTFVMLIGELDVSIAGTATVGAIMGAAVMNGQDGQILPAVAVTVGFGALVGLVNGLLVSRGVQSFILTLAVGTILLAAGAMYTGGTPLGIVAPSYTTFFFTPRLGVPTPAWALFLVVAVAFLIQRFTRFGQRIFLVGDNRVAAYHSGIYVNAMIIGAFVLSGACAALAGLVLLGRSGVPNDYSGMNLHFQALAAVALGGTAFAGGRGSVIGTFAGTLLIAISLGLGILLGWPFGAQLVEYGVLILIATVLYSFISGERQS
jgi:ribose transport system permease protein